MDRTDLGFFKEIMWYRHSIFVDELIVVSLFHERHKFHCHIIMSFTDVGILFFNLFLGTQLK